MSGTEAVNGIPLVVVVLGLVELSKRLGVKDLAAVAVSFLIGLVVGLGYQASLGNLTTYAGWFAAVLYGLGLGLVSSGVWDAGTQRATRKAADSRNVHTAPLRRKP